MLKFLPLALLIASVAFAQIGDRADKAGVVQKSLVPADQIPPAPALTPEQALKSFTVAPGFKLELAAAEPHVQEPVAVAFAPDGRMFASIGVACRAWCTWHGFALNVANDLSLFEIVNPCGLEARVMTSIARETGVAPSLSTVKLGVAREAATLWPRE